jgi:peptidyl-prolyl cis-trans isomerase SurA
MKLRSWAAVLLAAMLCAPPAADAANPFSRKRSAKQPDAAATPAAPPAAGAGAGSSGSAPPAAATQGQRIDRVVAVVNDGVVLESELDAQTEEFKRRLTAQKVQLPEDKVLREQVLERLIIEEVQAQRAERAGITVTDEQVNAALERMAKQQNIPFSKLPEAMAQAGYVYADFRSGIRRQMAREILQDRDVVQRITITPRELDQYIERQKNSASGDTEYNVSHILVAVAQDASAADQLAARKKIQDIADRIAKGEAFSQLAVTYSDSQTALEGGSLGWLKGSALPTFLAEVIARLKSGETSGIIQTATGFHLARLNETRTGSGPQIVQQVHLRHILLKTTEVLDDALAEQKLNDFRNKILAGEDFAVIARASSDDPGSAVQGGDLGWSTLEPYVPEFSKVAGSLQEKEISKPFRTQFGWHIVQLLGKRSFDNTETAAREQAAMQLRESRASEALELWLQQQRDEAYVENRL